MVLRLEAILKPSEAAARLGWRRRKLTTARLSTPCSHRMQGCRNKERAGARTACVRTFSTFSMTFSTFSTFSVHFQHFQLA